MKEIRCPKCGETFTIDEASYADIAKQVRDDEFKKELADRETLLVHDHENAIKLAMAEAANKYNEEIAKKDLELQKLASELKNASTEKDLAVKEATHDLNQQINMLKTEMEIQKRESLVNEQAANEKYTTLLKEKDEQIDYYKDLKARMSTKMVGETLEQHCAIEFNKIRMTAFPKAYFDKDNDAGADETKGDFIFRDFDENGKEYISIMFEMKNEMDDTEKKHKNADFFKKLDSDRKKKGCEYAVLVTMLEADNELYNQGIVDVSYEYEKMYVIRPQFFIPFITLVRNSAMKTLDYKHEIEDIKSKSIDITNFEDKLLDFQGGFNKNCETAFKYYEDAINKIDNVIKGLEKVKDDLRTSGNQLRLANNKAMDLSVKKLTHGNPTMTKMFEDAKKGEE